VPLAVLGHTSIRIDQARDNWCEFVVRPVCFEFDRDDDAPAIKVGAKLLRIGAVAKVLDEQKPVFIPDLAPEMLKYPDLASFAPEVVGRSTYLFPVSTFQKQFGILSTPMLPGSNSLRRMSNFWVLWRRT
jgi:hypothetical protein